MQFISKAWYRRAGWLTCLRPVAALFGLIVWARRQCYQLGLFKVHQFPVPIIIVGNITVGGSGKTPIVIALVELLQRAGFKPGVVSRGYGSKAPSCPQRVTDSSLALEVGDEPLLIQRRTECAVVVDPNRPRAVSTLLQDDSINVIISDDGLQHYALGRDVEIAVVDGKHRFGNQQYLPAGPLREPLSRLSEVDFILIHGEAQAGELSVLTQSEPWYRLGDRAQLTNVDALKQTSIHAVAGIAHPDKFFNTLREQGVTIIEHAFPDHHQFQESDFAFASDDVQIVMTEKDAVKCEFQIPAICWVAPIAVTLPEEFVSRLKALLAA